MFFVQGTGTDPRLVSKLSELLRALHAQGSPGRTRLNVHKSLFVVINMAAPESQRDVQRVRTSAGCTAALLHPYFFHFHHRGRQASSGLIPFTLCSVRHLLGAQLCVLDLATGLILPAVTVADL